MNDGIGENGDIELLIFITFDMILYTNKTQIFFTAIIDMKHV